MRAHVCVAAVACFWGISCFSCAGESEPDLVEYGVGYDRFAFCLDPDQALAFVGTLNRGLRASSVDGKGVSRSIPTRGIPLSVIRCGDAYIVSDHTGQLSRVAISSMKSDQVASFVVARDNGVFTELPGVETLLLSVEDFRLEAGISVMGISSAWQDIDEQCVFLQYPDGTIVRWDLNAGTITIERLAPGSVHLPELLIENGDVREKATGIIAKGLADAREKCLVYSRRPDVRVVLEEATKVRSQLLLAISNSSDTLWWRRVVQASAWVGATRNIICLAPGEERIDVIDHGTGLSEHRITLPSALDRVLSRRSHLAVSADGGKCVVVRQCSDVIILDLVRRQIVSRVDIDWDTFFHCRDVYISNEGRAYLFQPDLRRITEVPLPDAVE